MPSEKFIKTVKEYSVEGDLIKSAEGKPIASSVESLKEAKELSKQNLARITRAMEATGVSKQSLARTTKAMTSPPESKPERSLKRQRSLPESADGILYD